MQVLPCLSWQEPTTWTSFVEVRFPMVAEMKLGSFLFFLPRGPKRTQCFPKSGAMTGFESWMENHQGWG